MFIGCNIMIKWLILLILLNVNNIVYRYTKYANNNNPVKSWFSTFVYIEF